MATCDASELLNLAKCFTGLTTQEMELAKIELLCQILHASNPMASCDPDELMADAKCFAGLVTKDLQAIQVQLLCEILHGSGTGATCIVCVDGSDTPTDAATCDCSIAYNQDGQFWFWRSVTNSWQPFIV